MEEDGAFLVDINSSCYSSVIYSTSEPLLYECTAYCGASEHIADLTNNHSSNQPVNGSIILRLPPPMHDYYHCIVTGTTADGSIVFRRRKKQAVSG